MIIKDQKGGALIEFAIVLPLLILLVIGAIEFGLLCYNKQVIANASREGARAGIIAYNNSPPAGEPAGGKYFSYDAQIIIIVKNYCTNHLITFNGSPNLEDGDILLVPDDNYRTNASFVFGDPFEVKVSYDYDFLVPSLFGYSDIFTIKAATMMKREASI